VGADAVTSRPGDEVAIRVAATPEDIADVRALIQEYQRGLGIDLEFQGFAHELAHLDEMYGPPGGRLLLATLHAAPVGCVGLRRLDDRCCEMKRLYVRPHGRGYGLGRRLAIDAMQAARDAGYIVMRLDTLPVMREAQALYEQLGFRDVAPYRANPVAGTRFLEVRLW
jgi:putative acetyltransferase